MFTSGTDLARFVVAFVNGGTLDGKQVLSASLLKTLAAPHAEVPGGGHYGYGLHVAKYRGVELVSHGGSRVGYGSRVTMVPARRFGVIVLANRSGAGLPKTVDKALDLGLAFDPQSEAPPAPKPPPAELEKLAGAYRNGANAVELKWANGTLTLADGKASTAVAALGGTRFRASGEFDVVTGKGGQTVYLVRGGRAYKKQ
jgi:CubicO group peptidase (beta-lactamase class C family)